MSRPTWYAAYKVEDFGFTIGVVLDAELRVLDWEHHAYLVTEGWSAPVMPVLGQPLRLSCPVGTPWMPKTFGLAGRLAANLVVDFGEVLELVAITPAMRKRMPRSARAMWMRTHLHPAPCGVISWDWLMDFG
jgi:hypothetical protein